VKWTYLDKGGHTKKHMVVLITIYIGLWYC